MNAKTDLPGAPSLEGWARYAIYAAPPKSGRLGGLGAEWLGRDAESDQASGAGRRPAFAGLGLAPDAIAALVAAPARYGFHGTLKAPFRLASDASAEALDAALRAYAAERAPVEAPRLALTVDHGFVALRPSAPSPDLDARAAEIVERFDGFRAPMTPEERARRRADALDAEAEALLERWGYPWVMERFGFHLTLTGRLPPAEAEALSGRLAPIFAPALGEPFPLDDVALFGDPGDGPFRLLRRYRFSAG